MSEVPGAATFRTPAEAYDRHVGRYGRELARALIDAAGVAPGRRALDVGCGPGALTTELVALLGAEQVAAVEPSAAVRRHVSPAPTGVDVQVAAAEALPFDDAAFDHALAQLVVNFMTDPPAGVREMRRVTRPGGTVAAAVWDYAGEMTLLRRFWDAAVALDPSAAEQDEGLRMPFCKPDELGDLWSTAGLADVDVPPSSWRRTTKASRTSGIRSRSGVGPAGAYAAALPPERRAALKAELRRRLDAGDDPFRLTARAWIARGRVR